MALAGYTLSVSSIRRRNWPPVFLARRKLNSAVLNDPRCRNPVGEGANRVLAGFDLSVVPGAQAPVEWERRHIRARSSGSGDDDKRRTSAIAMAWWGGGGVVCWL
jgi:hypothetical protein